MRLTRILRRWRDGGDEYRLVFPRRIDRRRLVRDVARAFGSPPGAVRALYDRYRAFHREQRYEERFGERKTLNLDEAFVLYAALERLRPVGPIVEIGTQYGRSTRRILDMLDWMGLQRDVVCYDTVDQVEHFTPQEAELRVEDLTGRFRSAVLEDLGPGIVFLDAHPYHLTKEVVETMLADAHDSVLLIHDCGKALCNPDMTLAKDDLNITSATGHWERRVLCEVFGVDDPMTDEIDYRETPTHTLTVMQTTHGLGVVVPRALVEQP